MIKLRIRTTMVHERGRKVEFRRLEETTLTLVLILNQGIFRVIVYEPALQLASAQYEYTVRTIVKSRPIQSLRSPNSDHHNPHADLLKMLFWTVLGF